jgi:hypothetical protein
MPSRGAVTDDERWLTELVSTARTPSGVERWRQPAHRRPGWGFARSGTGWGFAAMGTAALAAAVVVLVGGAARHHEVSAPPAPASTAPAPTVALVGDTYVSQDQPSASFGTSAELRAGLTPWTHTYLRFTVKGTGGHVAAARLRIHALTAGPGFSISPGVDVPWTAQGLTWELAPPYTAFVGRVNNAFKPGDWLVVDVTPAITGDGTYTLVLTSSSKTPIVFSSSRDPGRGPQLQVDRG